MSKRGPGRPKKHGFTSVYMSLPDELAEAVKKQAETENRTVAGMYAHCLKNYLKSISTQN